MINCLWVSAIVQLILLHSLCRNSCNFSKYLYFLFTNWMKNLAAWGSKGHFKSFVMQWNAVNSPLRCSISFLRGSYGHKYKTKYMHTKEHYTTDIQGYRHLAYHFPIVGYYYINSKSKISAQRAVIGVTV